MSQRIVSYDENTWSLFALIVLLIIFKEQIFLKRLIESILWFFLGFIILAALTCEFIFFPAVDAVKDLIEKEAS